MCFDYFENCAISSWTQNPGNVDSHWLVIWGCFCNSCLHSVYLKTIFTRCLLGKYRLGTVTPFQVASLHLVLKLETLFYFLLVRSWQWLLDVDSLPTPLNLQGMVAHCEGPESFWSSAVSPGSHMWLSKLKCSLTEMQKEQLYFPASLHIFQVFSSHKSWGGYRTCTQL